jgi:hypothetical protein
MAGRGWVSCPSFVTRSITNDVAKQPTDLDASIRSKPVFEWVVRGDDRDGQPSPTRNHPPVPDAQAWAAITAMTGLELSILGLLAVWNLCTYAFVWMMATPGLGFRRAMVMTQATTAVANTVPGGSAIGIGMTYGMLRSWGYSCSSDAGHAVSAGHAPN